MNVEIRETMDGSQTLYLGELDEHYHSTFGAIQESQHVFIGAGFKQCGQNEIRVLEIGFGTGLNCYLTLLAGLGTGKKVWYNAIEKFPLPEKVWDKLEFTNHFPETNPEWYRLIHQALWNCGVEVQHQFLLHKIEADLLDLEWDHLPLVDLVYFDAFSPEKQPELWSRSIFEKIFDRMNPKGILVTYCAKGIVRRTLQSIGFEVERIPGPPGKREMIRATKYR
ncbi:MAG: tRNA (5-methylaminomethyl-2-thiouridine)(34)-methyltransferase MnmD [Prolixibacteraceae bacterium]|nr:tRNA (5-methylaminomethyl-2-thiouridine)(34)-methyltransferase MnmD [Prolixibacteraceae bacterium]